MNDVDDVILEAEDGEGSTKTPEQRLQDLRQKLKLAQTEAAENLAGWQRSKADYVNLQKRSRDDLAGFQASARTALVTELVDLFDSIEAAGHEALLRQLDHSLKKLGIERFRPEPGSGYDPGTAEAVSTVATQVESDDNKIYAVLQSGYRVGEILIRPARVTVQHYG